MNGQSGSVMGNQVGPLRAWALKQNLKSTSKLHPLDAPGDITGKDVMYFKNKLDKALAFYPEVPRCSESGHSYDRNLRKSNSLCNHYRDGKIKHIINSMTKV